MKNEFPIVALREILTPVSRPEHVDPGKTYNILGAHWYAEGLYLKDTKPGSSIQADRVYQVKQGDFVYNRLFAWKGSFALASADNHNCYVSNEFPTFAINQQRANAHYLWRYFSRISAWEEALGLSTGGTPTSRNRLKEEKLLAMEIPLPPLEEQRRIVARIEELAAKIAEARGLRKEVEVAFEYLDDVAKFKFIGGPPKCVYEVANVTKLAGFEYTEYFTNAEPGEVKVIRAGNVRNYGLDLTHTPTISKDISNMLPRSQLFPHDVVMTFIGANIGDVTFVPDGYTNLHCGPNVAKITPFKEISHLYLSYILRSPIVRSQIQEITKSTAQPSLSMKTIRSLSIPVPSLDKQIEFVNHMRKIDETSAKAKFLLSESSAELDALLPSILDKAFKGEL